MTTSPAQRVIDGDAHIFEDTKAVARFYGLGATGVGAHAAM